MGRLRALRDPGLLRLRAATVAMSAALLSFFCAWPLERHFHLGTSSVVLAVVLALTLGRVDSTGGHSWRRHLLAPVMLPLLAVASTEIGERLFTHPDLGDALYVVGMSGAIWVRRFGPRGRQIGTLLSTALIAVLITPGPAVPLGTHAPSRWWAAVVALIALAWTRIARLVAEHTGFIPFGPVEHVARVAAPATPARSRPLQRRIAPSTKMALQMGAALAAAFASGRAVFGMHWTWVVLSAYIVGSGNRGRGDVTYKAVMRLAGAAGGTLIATMLSGAFAPGDDIAIVFLFVVVAIALWLRPLSYAFWAAGMTAALALLYDYYGETGGHLLLTRLEGILLGASIGVLAAWVVLPIRNVDVVRRQLSIALATLAEVVGRGSEPVFAVHEVASYRASIRAGDLAGTSLRALRHLPRSCRSALPYGVACRALANALPQAPPGADVRLSLTADDHAGLARDITAARRALPATASAEQRAVLGETVDRIAAAIGASYR